MVSFCDSKIGWYPVVYRPVCKGQLEMEGRKAVGLMMLDVQSAKKEIDISLKKLVGSNRIFL